MCLTEFDEVKYSNAIKDETRAELILKMLKSGKTPEAISEFCEVPLDEILRVQVELAQPV